MNSSVIHLTWISPPTIEHTGLLDSPSTLTVKNTSSSAIKITWTPPFTLDITDVDPDISSYTVYITNTNTGTVSVTKLDESGVVETEYTFTGLPGEDPDPCHVYQFSVSAWNVVGEGERSGPVEGWFLGGIRTTSSGIHALLKKNMHVYYLYFIDQRLCST